MRKLIIWLVLAVSALTTACTVGPDFKRPAPPATDSTARVSNGDDIAADWYGVFHSEALNGLIRQALANSPDLAAARHSLEAAQYELRATSGSTLPQIDVTGQVGRDHANGSLLYGPVNELNVTGNRFMLGPSLAYNLDLFGGIRRSVEAQRAATSSVRDQVLDTYITLVDQVTINAFNYAATRAQIEVTQTLVEKLNAQYQLTERLEQAGKSIRSDTLLARTQLKNVAATIPGLERQRDAYRNALAQLTGVTPDNFHMPELSLRDFSLPAAIPDSVPSVLVQHRPDILAAEDNLHQASARIGVARAARFPSITLSAQYAQQTTAINDFLTRPGSVWSVGADLAAPLFHGGTLSAREQEAKEQYLQSQEMYRKTVIAAFVEVANSLQAIEHDRDAYVATTEALESARANSDLAHLQFRSGRFTELQVLTAEQQYQQAALTQVQADVQRFTDIATLFRALGGGWWNSRSQL